MYKEKGLRHVSGYIESDVLGTLRVYKEQGARHVSGYIESKVLGTYQGI